MYRKEKNSTYIKRLEMWDIQRWKQGELQEKWRPLQKALSLLMKLNDSEKYKEKKKKDKLRKRAERERKT